MVLGYLALTLLFQTAQMWVSPSVITARWNLVSHFLYPVLPDAWLNATPATAEAIWIRAAYLLLMSLLFLMYVRVARQAYASLHTAENSRKVLLLIIGVAGFCLLLLLLGRGILSTDLYSYVWYGRIPAIEGGNPYLNPPQDYLALDVEGWMEWEVWNGMLPCVYGPVWVFLAEGIAHLSHAVGGKELAVHVLGHRILSDIAHLIDIWLVWRVAGAMGPRLVGEESDSESVRRKRAALQVGATLTYAWNPLVLVEFGLSGHNDSIMIMFLLISLLLLVKGWWRWSAVALAAAGLTKLVALLFLPFYLIWLWRMFNGKGVAEGVAMIARARVFRIAQVLLIMGLVWALVSWPFGGPSPFLDALLDNPTVSLQINSIAAVILFGIPPILYSIGWLARPASPGREAIIGDLYRTLLPWVRLGQQAVAGVLLLATLRKAWRASIRGTLPVLEGWSWALVFFYMFGSLWFWPWYMSWLFVPLALVGHERERGARLWTAGQVLALSAMSIYALFPPPAGLVGWENFTGLLAVVPTALYLLVSWLSDRGRRRQ